MTKPILTEARVRELTKEEIQSVFGTLFTDVRDIKRALLGDDLYGDNGIVKDLLKQGNVVNEIVAKNMVARGEEAIKWYEIMNNSDGKRYSKIQILNSILDGYTSIRILVAAVLLFSSVNAATGLVDIVKWIFKI